MKLFQLLRILSPNIPILLFDLSGKEICRALSKEDLSIDLFEYDVFGIDGISQCEFYHSKIPALAVSIVK